MMRSHKRCLSMRGRFCSIFKKFINFPISSTTFNKHSKNDFFNRRLLLYSIGYSSFCVSTTLILAQHQYATTDKNLYDTISFIKSNNMMGLRDLLKNEKIDINNKIIGGWNLLHIAVVSQNKDAVKFLLEMGADPNCVDDYEGARTMTDKMHKNVKSVLQERLAHFADFLNPYPSYVGFTPLHYAAFLDDKDIIKVLMDGGADPNLKNFNEETAADLCLVDDTKKILMNYVSKYKDAKIKIKISNEPLQSMLEANLVGQKCAISAVSNAVLRKLSGWCLQDGPLVLLFLGSSGVGKTETAKLVAKYVSNDNKKGFIRLDMSEYQEKHQVARMIGSPPGYIGYEEGGQLTKMLKHCPNSVVLFDEIEKAHPDVLTILLQLFDEGRITDSKGETIDASNAIFIMTSNLGSEVIREHATELRKNQKLSSNINDTIIFSRDFKNNYIYPILKRNFKRDEFLGRINEVVYFLPFSSNELKQLSALQLNKAAHQIKMKHNIELNYTEDVLEVIASGFDPIYGARSIQNQVEIVLLSPLANMFIHGRLDHVEKVVVTTKQNGNNSSISIETVKLDESQATSNSITSKITSIFS